jgi:hypothetical protein
MVGLVSVVRDDGQEIDQRHDHIAGGTALCTPIERDAVIARLLRGDDQLRVVVDEQRDALRSLHMGTNLLPCVPTDRVVLRHS